MIDFFKKSMKDEFAQFRKRLVLSLLALAAGGLPYLWWDHSQITLFTRVWREGKVEEFTRNWKQLDRRLLEASGGGNLAIRFVGFNPEQPEHARTAQEAAWRGAYALYPKRVFVAEPGTVINNADDILAKPFVPSVEWLQEHDVQVLLTLISTGEQSFVPRVEHIPPRGGQ
jgi:hypothetical protein